MERSREDLGRALLKAIEDLNLCAINDILSNGADPNLLIEPEGISAMHLFLGLDNSDSLTITRLMLRHGGNPNVRSCDGLTPIHVCSAWGKIDALKLLLKYGGDPNLADFDGNTVMSLALDNGHLEVIDVLHAYCDKFNKPTTDACRSRVGAIGNGDQTKSRESLQSEMNSSTACNSSATTTSSDELNLAFVSVASVPALVNDSSRKLCLNRPTANASECFDSNNGKNGSSVTSELDSCSTYCTVDEYLFVDAPENIALLERQYVPFATTDTKQGGDCPSSSSSLSTSSSSSSNISISSVSSVPASLKDLPDNIIVQKLKSLGDIPGPLTNTTRRVYLRRLHCLLNGGHQISATTLLKDGTMHSQQLSACLSGRISTESYRNLEVNFLAEFGQPKACTAYRGGALKSCFNYLLLDPRILQNLPQRAPSLSTAETLRTFVNAIFYVGKGQQARAYDHFYEALRSSNYSRRISAKVKRIQEIWNDKFGVVSLHCFIGTIAAEAFTREACLIDAIGKSNLTNERCGNYYGSVAKWMLRDKCKLGCVFLQRAMYIFLQEGERQIYPFNLATNKSSWRGNKR